MWKAIRRGSSIVTWSITSRRTIFYKVISASTESSTIGLIIKSSSGRVVPKWTIWRPKFTAIVTITWTWSTWKLSSTSHCLLFVFSTKKKNKKTRRRENQTKGHLKSVRKLSQQSVDFLWTTMILLFGNNVIFSIDMAFRAILILHNFYEQYFYFFHLKKPAILIVRQTGINCTHLTNPNLYIFIQWRCCSTLRNTQLTRWSVKISNRS